LVLVALLAVAAPAAARTREARVGAAVRAVMAKWEIPGVILGVWQRGQAPIVEAYGARNVDPISKYVTGVPNGGKITVRELAEMRSGLVNYSDSEAWGREFLAEPLREWKPSELLAASFALPPSFPPGKTFEYSNTNFVLLGLLVEKVTGERIGPYIERHVLAPLRLKQTLFPRGAEFPQPHADGYTAQTPTQAVANSTDWSPSWAWSAGAMISDLHDLRIWAKAVATGTLLRPAIQRQRERFIPIPGLAPARYGLGLFEVNGWIGHDGEVPGYESLTVYLPAKEATMVILANSDIGEPSRYLGEAVTRVITPRNVYTFGPHPR
jgi:D-alanyl-D-alanine carboxypeptidase